MISRAGCEAWFRGAVTMCDPAELVRRSLRVKPVTAPAGIAIGKAAMGMARGVGPIARGVVVSHTDDGQGLPGGWSLLISAAPEASRAASEAVIDLVATTPDHVLALISEGADTLCERLAPDGSLARSSDAAFTTLVIAASTTDGPTIAHRPGDRVELLAALESFAWAIDSEIEAGEFGGPHVPTVYQAAMKDDVEREADDLIESLSWVHGVAWGRGQPVHELAFELARRLRGKERAAFVASTTGGPGVFVDGTAWDALLVTGLDDAAAALNAIGASADLGTTGVYHGVIVIVD
jgi:glycerate-2-kinase